MRIRTANLRDARGICDIWNSVIRDTLITFTTEEKNPDAVAADIAARGPAYVVAERDAGRIAGFATYGAFRSGPGYAFTREHTVMLAPDARATGTGRALMDALENVALSENVHSLIGGISGENPGGVAFHRSIGFHEAGRVPECGFKAGRWIDLVLMQKILGPPR